MDFKNIKLLLSDVDGVLTDGGLYYSAEGMVLKKFNVKDGMGVVRLKENGVLTGILSSDDSQIIKTRAEKLKMEVIVTGSKNKLDSLNQICEEFNLTPAEVAFIGDDVIDIEILKNVGFSSCPADALEEVKQIVNYICKKKGGEGCFREVAEMIIMGKSEL